MVDVRGGRTHYTYQYDLLGNKVDGYDPLGRLNGVTKEGNQLRSYHYDAFGDRISLTEKEKTTTYAYNSVNQLLSRVDADLEETYTYDKRGNLSQIVDNGKTKNQYLYGASNRLEFVENQDADSEYCYNGLGYRVKEKKTYRNTSGITQNSDNHIVYTLDITKTYNNLLQKNQNGDVQLYLWDNRTAISVQTESETNYFQQDELGSIIRLYNECPFPFR